METDSPTNPVRPRVGLVYDRRMCDHSTPDGEYHPENQHRIKAIWKKLKSAGVPQRCVVMKAEEAKDKYIALVHKQSHVDLIRNISSTEFDSRRKKVASKFNSVFLNEGSSQAAYLAAGAVIEVSEKVARGELDSAVAIVRPPGHHAEVDEAMGFCLFNNVAVAASFLLNERPELGIRKILIVDWDVHHGNGTQKMFWEDPRVLFFSVHRFDSGKFFPLGNGGSHSMIGGGLGEGFNVNVPWEQGWCGDADYFAVWDHILIPITKAFNPDMILISGGFDAAAGDPQGGCCVTPYGYSVMMKKLMEFAQGRIVMALEGGYNLDSLANSVLACVKALLEDKPIVGSSKGYPLESTWRVIRAVREKLSTYWETLADELVIPKGLSRTTIETSSVEVREKVITYWETLADEIVKQKDLSRTAIKTSSVEEIHDALTPVVRAPSSSNEKDSECIVQLQPDLAAKQSPNSSTSAQSATVIPPVSAQSPQSPVRSAPPTSGPVTPAIDFDTFISFPQAAPLKKEPNTSNVKSFSPSDIPISTTTSHSSQSPETERNSTVGTGRKTPEDPPPQKRSKISNDGATNSNTTKLSDIVREGNDTPFAPNFLVNSRPIKNEDSGLLDNDIDACLMKSIVLPKDVNALALVCSKTSKDGATNSRTITKPSMIDCMGDDTPFDPKFVVNGKPITSGDSGILDKDVATCLIESVSLPKDVEKIKDLDRDFDSLKRDIFHNHYKGLCDMLELARMTSVSESLVKNLTNDLKKEQEKVQGLEKSNMSLRTQVASESSLKQFYLKEMETFKMQCANYKGDADKLKNQISEQQDVINGKEAEVSNLKIQILNFQKEQKLLSMKCSSLEEQNTARQQRCKELAQRLCRIKVILNESDSPI